MKWLLVFAVVMFLCIPLGLGAAEMIWNGELEVKLEAPIGGKEKVNSDATTSYGNFYLDMTAKVDEFNEVLYEFGSTGPGKNYTVDEVYINTDWGKMQGWKMGLKSRIGHVNLKSKDFSLMTDYAYEKDSTRDGFKSGGFLLKPSMGKFYGQYGIASYKGLVEDQALVGIAGIGPLQYFELSHNSFDPSIFAGMHLKFGSEKVSVQTLAGYKHLFFDPAKENFYGLSSKLMIGKTWLAAAVGGNNTNDSIIASAEAGYDNGKFGTLEEITWSEVDGWKTAEVFAWKRFGAIKIKPGLKFAPDYTAALLRAVVTW